MDSSIQKRTLGKWNLEVSAIGLCFMSMSFPAIHRRLRPAVRRTTVAEPQAEARRTFGIQNAARDERAFLRNGTGAVVRGFGRTAAGEEQQESALVTAGSRNCQWIKSYILKLS